MKKEPYKPRKAFWGINNWLKRRTAKTADAQNFGRMFFKTVLFVAPYTKIPILGDAILNIAYMADRHHTAGYSLPLNVDLSNKIEQSALPIELMKKVVKESSTRAIINTCMCRETFKCHDYPVDLGCLFIGKGAKTVVDNGIAHEATVEECYAHIDKAASLGLAGKAFWVEVEEYVWGIKDEDMQSFLEICFCCPCCCAAFTFDRKSGRSALNQSVGWKATVADTCNLCGACIKACPTDNLSLGTSKVVVNSKCSGCGICINACKQKALCLQQKQVLKEDVKDYFEGLDLKL